jgi:predicted ferric reductase
MLAFTQALLPEGGPPVWRERSPRGRKDTMRRRILLATMAVFVLIPAVNWATTLVAGAPLASYVYALGRLLALVGFIFLLFQFVLSSRVHWIERRIGLDKLIGIHRTSGKIGMALILVHPAALFLSDILFGSMPVLNREKLVGVAAMIVFIVAVGAALLYARLRLRYETWRAIHAANYVALPLGLLHSLAIGSDVRSGPLGGFWLLLAALYIAVLGYRVWRWVDVRRHPYRVVGVSQETHDTWSVRFDGRRVAYEAGQFMFVRLARKGRLSDAHPFTISSSPTSDTLSITVKQVGDFTSTVGETTIADHAYIDAPYGVFSYANHDGPDLVFIAGGIGITPFMSMLRDMRDRNDPRNVLLIWGNKAERDITFRDELAQLEQAIASLRVIHVMSRQEDWPGERGYVDRQRLARYLDGIDNPQIFVCGPSVMMDMVIAALRELDHPRSRIHYERFALR